MPRVKLTDLGIDKMKAPKGGQVDYFDAGFPGLALRVGKSGTKTWIAFGRVDGKVRRVTLGRFRPGAFGLTAARQAAGEAMDQMKRGLDPGVERRREEEAAAAAEEATRKADLEAEKNKVGTVIAEWLRRDQATKRSRAEVERVMEHDVLPHWKNRAITEIGRRDVIELIDRIADRGAVTMARRTHAHLHRLFRWCVGRGIIAASPMMDLPKPGETVKRDRVLGDAELAEVWAAAGTLGYPFGPAIRLLALTGARREEIGALRWSEVDLAERKINLSGERTKNGEARTIPLSDVAAEIVENLPRMKNSDRDSEFVFTTTGETAISGWSRAKAVLDKAIIEARREDLGDAAEPMPAWRLHDLRRTLATGLQRLHVPLQVTEEVLGHISGSRSGVVGVYQRHTFEPEKRAALDTWARRIDGLVSEHAAGNVVELAEARA